MQKYVNLVDLVKSFSDYKEQIDSVGYQSNTNKDTSKRSFLGIQFSTKKYNSQTEKPWPFWRRDAEVNLQKSENARLQQQLTTLKGEKTSIHQQIIALQRRPQQFLESDNFSTVLASDLAEIQILCT